MEDFVHHTGSIDSDKITAEVHVVRRIKMKFSLGRIVWTRGVNDRVAVDTSFAKFVMDSLKRHANCDWGDLSAEDKRENDFSLDKELRLLSSYQHDDCQDMDYHWGWQVCDNDFVSRRILNWRLKTLTNTLLQTLQCMQIAI